MKIYHGIEGFKKLDKAIVTSGTFDGVHVGHQKILRRLTEIAQDVGGETVLITFWPHPRLVLDKAGEELKLLSTFEEKAEILKELGIQHLVKIPFTKEFSELTSEQFIRNILVDVIGTYKLVIGYDHRFGKNREGSFEHLVQNAPSYGFQVEEIPRQDIDDLGVSSTRIRHSLDAGAVELMRELTGRNYFIKGKVVPGHQLGRTIDFPTANIQISENFKLVPADGVYAVRIKTFEGSHLGMLNIGVRPTANGQQRTIEAHVFDFNGDLYQRFIEVEFVARIRSEQKFPDMEALKVQLQEDKKLALELLK
jgi:riboflavin kinase / FMN adenylyltransferase